VSSAIWSLEWRLAAKRPRVFAVSVVVPLALVAVVTLGGAPPVHVAVVCTALFAMFGTFGAAVPWARDAERGFLARLALTGQRPEALVGERIVANALLDFMELLPSAAVVLVAGRPGTVTAVAFLVTLAAAMVLANTLGVWLATLADSLGETALFSAVGSLLLLHASGVFRTPTGGIAETLQVAIPWHHLHLLMREVIGVGAGSGDPIGAVAAALGGAALVLFLTATFSPWLVRRAARVP
jgi:hypothetical protein